MPHNTGWENGKFARAKKVTKTFLKKFGPLILTGLVAVVKHHWLDHTDESAEDAKSRDKTDEPNDKHSIRKLESEVAELKRSLSRKPQGDEESREARPAPRIREEIVREWRLPYQEQHREQYVRGRTVENERPLLRSQQQYHKYLVAQQVQSRREPEILDQSLRFRERQYIRPSHRRPSIQRRRRRHRHSSVPNRSSYEDEFSVHAGKVAALAGFVEAMHVGDIRGDWIGPKGVRVGTTMAASFAASRSRDRDPDDVRGHEVVADVGTGLLVSRLLHGSSRRLEEDEKVTRGRRWSYCY
jgi:hypothetical protein